MKLSSREIINIWINQKVNLTNIERILEIPFGTLIEFHRTEGPVTAELEILLNIIYNFPWLLNIAENNFKIN